MTQFTPAGQSTRPTYHNTEVLVNKVNIHGIISIINPNTSPFMATLSKFDKGNS